MVDGLIENSAETKPRSEESKQEESQKEFYTYLLDRLKISKDRNDTLVNRAQTLLGLGGIINTILVALIVTFMNSTATAIPLIKNSPYLPLVGLVLIFGFGFYIASIILALMAYRTVPHTPVPQINSIDLIREIFDNKVKVSLEGLSLQACEAIDFYDSYNLEKFDQLNLATMFLTIAITLTAILAFLIILAML